MKRTMLITSCLVLLMFACIPFGLGESILTTNHTPTSSREIPPPATAISAETPAATPITCQATVTANGDVNLYSGPDTAYAQVGDLEAGEKTRLKGRNDDNTWWYVSDPISPQAYGWVQKDMVTAECVPDDLPIIPASSISTPLATTPPRRPTATPTTKPSATSTANPLATPTQINTPPPCLFDPLNPCTPMPRPSRTPLPAPTKTRFPNPRITFTP